MAVSETLDCYTAIQELDAAMRSSLEPDANYFVLGGIMTSAVKHPDTAFDHDGQSVIPPSDAAESTIRDNGTRRDVDILVPTVLSKERAERIKAAVVEATGDSLLVSVFGFDEHNVPGIIGRTKSAVFDWTSRRTIDEDGTIRYNLHPIEQVVPAESFRPWQLELGDKRVQVLSPAAHLLAYHIRSISGRRAKDKVKIDAAKERVLAEPEFVKQIWGGELDTWRQFANSIEKMLAGVALKPGDPHFVASATDLDQGIAWAKGRSLRLAESSPVIVDFGQKESVQRVLNVFTRAK